MNRIFQFSEQTQKRARELLEADMEMLHVFAGEDYCEHCGRKRYRANFFEECPALLRCVLQMLTRPVVKAE